MTTRGDPCGWCQYNVPETLLARVAALCNELCCPDMHPVELSHAVSFSDSSTHKTTWTVITIFHHNTLQWRLTLKSGRLRNVVKNTYVTWQYERFRDLLDELLLVPCQLKRMILSQSLLELSSTSSPSQQQQQQPIITTTLPTTTTTTPVLKSMLYQLPPVVRPLLKLEDLLVQRVFDTKQGTRVVLPSTQLVEVPTQNASIILRNQLRFVLDLIQSADAIVMFGYVASGTAIFEALQRKERVLMLMQKRPFMMSSSSSGFARKFQSNIAQLNGKSFCPHNFFHAVPWLRHCLPGDRPLQVLRCLGMCQNTNNAYTVPLLHDKCLIALKRHKSCPLVKDDMPPCYEPYSVWISTDNFTENAQRSLGTGVVIDDPKTARIKLNLIMNYLLSSEPVPFKQETLSPEWRRFDVKK